MELHNEGSTAIFYHWEKLVVPRSFAKLRSQTRRPCFYFNHSSGKWKHSRTPGSTSLHLVFFTRIRIFLKMYKFFFLCILLFCLRLNATLKPQKLRSSQVTNSKWTLCFAYTYTFFYFLAYCLSFHIILTNVTVPPKENKLTTHINVLLFSISPPGGLAYWCEHFVVVSCGWKYSVKHSCVDVKTEEGGKYPCRAIFAYDWMCHSVC